MTAEFSLLRARRRPRVARVNFTPLRKGGLDPNEVRLHLEAVAREMGHLENRIRELQDQLVDAQRRAANPTFDEATLAGALGAQSAAILRSAHEEAGRVTAEAQERSAQVFAETPTAKRDSPHRGPGTSHGIHHRGREHRGADRPRARASRPSDSIESAKVNGEALVEHAREQGRAIVEQSNEARRSVLNDLAVKRKALHLQIEQLRAARDTLGSFVASVRQQVDDVLEWHQRLRRGGPQRRARGAALRTRSSPSRPKRSCWRARRCARCRRTPRRTVRSEGGGADQAAPREGAQERSRSTKSRYSKTTRRAPTW